MGTAVRDNGTTPADGHRGLLPSAMPRPSFAVWMEEQLRFGAPAGSVPLPLRGRRPGKAAQVGHGHLQACSNHRYRARGCTTSDEAWGRRSPGPELSNWGRLADAPSSTTTSTVMVPNRPNRQAE